MFDTSRLPWTPLLSPVNFIQKSRMNILNHKWNVRFASFVKFLRPCWNAATIANTEIHDFRTCNFKFSIQMKHPSAPLFEIVVFASLFSLLYHGNCTEAVWFGLVFTFLVRCINSTKYKYQEERTKRRKAMRLN